MSNRKNKGKKAEEKKSTSTNKNWWETGDWKDKIEDGRLHIYTWLMLKDKNDEKGRNENKAWSKLIEANIPGLEYWTTSKWRKLSSWKSSDGHTMQGYEGNGGWHLRQKKNQARVSKKRWEKLAEDPDRVVILSVENEYETSVECCDRRVRKRLNNATRR